MRSKLPALTCLLFVLSLSVSAADRQSAGYLDTIPVFWSNLYPDGGETLYCGVKFKPRDRRTNIEHVYPMSWVTKSLRCGDRDRCRQVSEKFNRIESDMHNLFPSLKSTNKMRGSMPFAMIKGERRVEPRCDLEIDYRSRRVEPRPAVRGDIARAALYMADRYDLELYRRQRELLERWHRQDPPGEEERRRNEVIERLQGNRNPWIDRVSPR